MKILNLYAGLGGNRKLWSDEHDITAVEISLEIARIYQHNFPNDKMVVADAHKYLENHYEEFDFIWSSPPCQSHSSMVKATRHKGKKFPDMKLYEEIIFLQNFFEGLFVVENVKPYYKPLIQPTQEVGRHLLWSNFVIHNIQDVDRPKNFINKTNVEGSEDLKKWLGIEYEGNIYYKNNHCPAQVLRNCVHPLVGKQILEYAMNTVETQKTLF